MIRDEQLAGFPLISIFGEVDYSNSAALDEVLAAHDADPFVVLSLEECSFLDSTVLSVLIRHHVKRNGHFAVVLPEQSRLARMFDITGLRELLRLVVDRRAALELAATMRDVEAVHFSRDGVRSEER